MAYNSPLYLFAFFPLVLAAYYICPQRHRSRVLLLASYVFFYSISGKLLIYLLLSTLLIHHTGLWLDHCRSEEKKELAVTQDKKSIKSSVCKKTPSRPLVWNRIPAWNIAVVKVL